MIQQRLRSQLLAGAPARDPVAVADRLLAVQAQDWRGMLLAVRARTAGLTATAVVRAITVERSLVITWLNRGTLHLVRAEDYHWLLPLTAPSRVGGAITRLAHEGVSSRSAERGVAVIAAALASDGPLTRSQLRERVSKSCGISTTAAVLQLLFLASQRGLMVRGPLVGREQAFALTRDWLGPPGSLSREESLTELARRYLRGHAPATDRDLAQWAGIPLRDARQGLRSLGTELVERGEGMLQLSGSRPRVRAVPPRLLGPFDPLLLGWNSREPVLGAHQEVITTNGLFRPFAMVDRRAVGVWKLSGETVTLQPFRTLGVQHREELARDAREVARYLGLPERPMVVRDPRE